MSKATKREKRNRTFPVLIILVLIALTCILGVAGEVIARRLPTKERADLSSIYGAEEGYAAVIANHQLAESKAVWRLGHAYLPYRVIREELNSHFYWDPVEEILLYTLPEEVVQADSEMAYDDAPVLLEQDDTIYVALSYVEKYTNIQVSHFETPNRIVLQTEWGTEQIGTLKKKTAVRQRGGIRSPIVTELEAGEEVVILEPMERWSGVQTSDGFLGYVQNKDIAEIREEVMKGPYEEPEYTSIHMDEKVTMVWHQLFDNSGLTALQEFLRTDPPVNVISPGWFTISDEDGSIQSLADPQYVQTAHAAGLQVWPMVENINIETTSADLLLPTTHRRKLVEGLMAELEACGADGLNVDLEQISSESGEGFIQFIRELSAACRKRGLVLSVDNGVPSSGGLARYHVPEQGEFADYVIVMAYDEHYRGGEPGSTASLPFVQQAISDTLAMVPEEKVICGVPFYTRLWTETSSGTGSEAMGMDAAAAFAKEQGMSVQWLDELGQNYARAEEDGTVYELWLEDSESMQARMQVIDAYRLAGAAFWKLGLQNSSAWEIIRRFS